MSTADQRMRGAHAAAGTAHAAYIHTHTRAWSGLSAQQRKRRNEGATHNETDKKRHGVARVVGDLFHLRSHFAIQNK